MGIMLPGLKVILSKAAEDLIFCYTSAPIQLKRSHCSEQHQQG